MTQQILMIRGVIVWLLAGAQEGRRQQRKYSHLQQVYEPIVFMVKGQVTVILV